MPILLPAIGLLVTILFLLSKLNIGGANLASSNPFLWQRRHAWARNLNFRSAYGLTVPIEAVALLMTAVARSDGDMSRGQEKYMIDIFEHEFLLNNSQALALLTSSVYISERLAGVPLDVARVLQPCLERFTTEKAVSALQWLHDIATGDGPVSPRQKLLLDQAYAVLDDRFDLELLYTSSLN